MSAAGLDALLAEIRAEANKSWWQRAIAYVIDSVFLIRLPILTKRTEISL